MTNHAKPGGDGPGERSALAADVRDDTAGERDSSASGRDDTAAERDRCADDRDAAAEQRDRLAEQAEALLPAGQSTAASTLSAVARTHARADRRAAFEDRCAGVTRRIGAGHDRDAALSDRRASAVDRESASVDGLTGVYRRDEGFAELEREVARAHRMHQRLLVAFLDADHFKALNDAHGHAAGDLMLHDIAATLRAELRSYDLIFRYGGDELVCAMPGVDRAEAGSRLARVNITLGQRRTPGSISTGMADLQPGDSANSMVARADTELYRIRQARSATT